MLSRAMSVFTATMNSVKPLISPVVTEYAAYTTTKAK
jgi:hypothetical protein